jgi:hypothetical protein
MYLPLDTIHIWQIDISKNIAGAFAVMLELIQDNDVIVFACYEPSDALLALLDPMSVDLQLSPKPYIDTIEANLSQYPNARLLHIPAQKLKGRTHRALFEKNTQGMLPFDHLMGFKLTRPFLPLFLSHDTNFAEPLRLSGHYTKAEVANTFGAAKFKYERMLNPQLD